MVTRNDQPQEVLPGGEADLQEFNIQDSTSPDQLEIEAELDAELAQDDADVEVQADEYQGAEQGVQRTPEPGAQTKAESQEVASPTAPQVRTYSQEEVAKMQSAYDRQIRQAQEQQAKLQAERDKFNLDAEVEARLRQYEASLVPSLGEEDARRIARDPSNVAAVRQAQEAINENRRLQQQIQFREQNEEQQAKYIVARQLVEANGLQAEDFEVLMATTNPEAMQKIAARLARETQRQKQEQQKRFARVPAETADTRVMDGRSTGAAPEDSVQKLNRIRQKPSWEWTQADHEFMRNGRL